MEYKKYVTFSFDDGLEQDKQIIEILRGYGLTASFNLNAGLFGQRGRIGRMGDFGMFDFPDKDSFAARFWKAVPAHRIPRDEIAQVYAGFEVASHGYHHDNLKDVHGEGLDMAIGRDIEALESLTGQKIGGFVYAKGNYTEEAEAYLRQKGIVYGRTAKPSGKFDFPENPLRFDTTAWLIQKQTLEMAEQFAQAEPTQGDLLLSFWGHGYEFDFGTPNCNWARFDALCERIAKMDDVICCTNRELFSRH